MRPHFSGSVSQLGRVFQAAPSHRCAYFRQQLRAEPRISGSTPAGDRGVSGSSGSLGWFGYSRSSSAGGSIRRGYRGDFTEEFRQVFGYCYILNGCCGSGAHLGPPPESERRWKNEGNLGGWHSRAIDRSIDSTIHRQDYIHSHRRRIKIWPLYDADKPATSKHRSGHAKHSWSMLVSHPISTVTPLMSCCNAAKPFYGRVK